MSQFSTWYRTQPTALRAILTINVVIYVLWLLLFSNVGVTNAFVWNHLALNPGLPGILLEPWQLVTYNFLHLSTGFWGLIHIGFNMLWLFWLGKEFEELHGPHYLMALYLLAGVAGGLLTVLAYAVLPGSAVVHGASASVLGVITAIAIMYPYKKIALLFIGTVRLLYVVIGFLVLDILFAAGSSTAVTAHVGGALGGFLFARGTERGWDLASWAQIFFAGRRSSGRSGSSRSGGRRSAPSSEGGGGGLSGWMRSLGGSGEAADRPADERERGRTLREERAERNAERNARAEEVDRILEKISERGYEALSEEEKRTLNEASQE